MNEKLFKVLEFYKILQNISKHCRTNIAREKILAIKPSTDINFINYELEKTNQAFNILNSVSAPPITAFEDIDEYAQKAQKGGILTIAQFYELKRFLKICYEVLKYFSDTAILNLNADKIEAIVSYITSDKEFLRELDRVFIDKENIADNATGELLKIRREIKSSEADIVNAVNSVLNNPSYRKYLSDTVAAMKNQRLTVPVRAEYKDAVKGVIHDISSTGSTVFIEPEKAFNLNNKLNELRVKENQETEKILAFYSEQTAARAEDIISAFDAVISLDMIFAKARYAQDIIAVKPEVTAKGNTCLYGCRHPLININEAVASDIVFNDSYNAIIITGPNTGGKTVALKTLGLLSVMAQSGILIPAKEYSKIRVFKKIFADIGDEQSIEQSLSTFSSHMKNIIQILNQADEDTLIIIDEIGAGTDPQEGAALGMAIIDDIIQKRSKAFISTHYSELKKYALLKKGAINASVQFDTATLKPTYKLYIGLPGESNAIKIAGRLGLSEDVLEKAKNYISSEDESFEQILKTIKEKQTQTEEYNKNAELKLREAEEYYAKAKVEHNNITQKKEHIINEAKSAAQKIIYKAKQESSTLINELISLKNSADIDLKKAESSRAQLSELENQLKPQRQLLDTSDDNESEALNPGDEVYIKHIGAYGTVTSQLGANEYEVVAGSMRVKFNSSQLKKIKKDKPSAAPSFKRQSKTVPISIDVRGMDSISALKEIDKYIDDASIAGYKSVMIIHGKGQGVLRKETLDFLKNNPLIRTYRQGAYNEGGSGVTVAELK